MLNKNKIKHNIAKYYGYLNKNKQSRIIYYHDIHRDNERTYYKYSTPISTFSKHVQLLLELGFEIVNNITKPYNQIMIGFKFPDCW